VAGIPGTVCSALANVDCDADLDTRDALVMLVDLSGISTTPGPGCLPLRASLTPAPT
jgi:hypothetical protein